MPNPTLRFLFEGGGAAERIWYHVPAVGDWISFEDHMAQVTRIFWSDERITVYCK